jgi:23S rRNA (cytidine2498-2'-O)-methyltransferase
MPSQTPLIACVAPDGFEKELAAEVGIETSSIHERLALIENFKGNPRRIAWSQNTWLNPVRIEFTSISDAAKKLRALAPFWCLHSTALHRRAQLIQDQLPKLRHAPLDFLSPLPQAGGALRRVGAWTLLNESTLLAATDCTSPLPNGAVEFNEDKLVPSRAYMKLWELFTVDGVRPLKGERCLELGAAPGGWTYVLAKLGCQVIAVDRADLAPHVKAMKGVETLQRNAFTLKPEDVGSIDWLFSDLICYPKDLFDLVEKWRASGLCRNFVCTLKFRGETDHATARAFEKIAGSNIRHLFVNKHELTWWLVQASTQEPD